MNELQTTILNLIKEIDAICRKYHITYYASGGTVIGAFRHGGFIPWDDDADIYMTRDNFHKFIEAFEKEKPQGRTLGSLEINPDYPGTLAHYRNDQNTSFVTRYHILNACDAGVLVDIFILDPIDDNPQHWDDHIGKLRIYADLNFPFYAYTNCGDTPYLSQYFEYAKKMKKHGKAAVNKELENELFTFPEEKATHYILRWGTLPHIFPKEMFEEPVYVDYEDFQLPMPTKWYDYLVKLYGYNWNEIPPSPADEGHVAVISTKYRYTNFLIDSDRFIDKKHALKMYFKRKGMLIKREILRRPFIEHYLDAKKQYILSCQKDYLNNQKIDIDELFKNKQYNDIIKAYDIYLSHQLDESYVGKMTHNMYNRFKNPIFIPLDDHELEILLYSLLYTCDFNRLNKLLNMRLNKQEHESFKTIQSILLKVHQIMEMYYEKDYKKVCELVEMESKDFIYSLERLVYLYYSSKMYCHQSLSDDEIKYITAHLEDDQKGYWKKAYGDYLLSIQDNQYLNYYQECLSITNDGFIINELNHVYHMELDYEKRMLKPKNVITNHYQEVSMQLLEEVTQILDDHDIPYFLIGRTLKNIYFKGALPAKNSSLEIAIKPEYVVQLMKVMENNEKFLTPMDDSRILIHGFKYKSPDNYYLRVLNNGKVLKQEIYVKIHILRKNSSNVLKRKTYNFLNLVYKVNQKGQFHIVYSLISRIFVGVIGKQRLRNLIFDKYNEMTLNNPSEEYHINRKKYDTVYFEKYDELYFYSKNFKIPQHIEDFFSLKQKESVLKPSPYNKNFFSIYIDNESHEDELKDTLLSNKKAIKNYQRALKLNLKLRPYHREARYNWNIILRSEDRFNLYLKYKDEKEQILALYEAKDYDQLWEKLADYDLLARRYLLKNLGLCFDKDIFHIYLDMLIQNDEEKVADKLKRLVPTEHLEEIKILNIE